MTIIFAKIDRICPAEYFRGSFCNDNIWANRHNAPEIFVIAQTDHYIAMPPVVSQRSFGVLFAAIQTGGAAEVAALSKESAWTAQAEAKEFKCVCCKSRACPPSGIHG